MLSLPFGRSPAFPLSVGLLLLAVAGLSAREGGGPSPLARADLELSRGDGQDFKSSDMSCNTLEGLSACTSSGPACTSCNPVIYRDNTAIGVGGDNAGVAGTGDCGDINNGTCQSYIDNRVRRYRCAIPALGAGDTGLACTGPVGLPTEQPINP